MPISDNMSENMFRRQWYSPISDKRYFCDCDSLLTIFLLSNKSFNYNKRPSQSPVGINCYAIVAGILHDMSFGMNYVRCKGNST